MNWFRNALNPVEAVIVQTRTGNTLRGVLVDQRDDAIVLRAASVMTLGVNNAQTWQKMVGDVVIPAANVDYYQTALPITVLDT